MVSHPTLYDRTAEFDACGIGFVADAHGPCLSRDRGPPRSRRSAASSTTARSRPTARTGDGTGLLMPIPSALFRRSAAGSAWSSSGVMPPGRSQAVLPRPGARRARVAGGRRRQTADAARGGRRAGQTRRGRRAAFPSRRRRLDRGDEHEHVAFRAPGHRASPDPAATSLRCSFRTVVHKGLVAADRWPTFYVDLAATRPSRRFAVFHQRFSTNTAAAPGSAPSPSVCSATTVRSTRSAERQLGCGARGDSAPRRSGSATTPCSRRCSTPDGSDSGDARHLRRAARPGRPRRAPLAGDGRCPEASSRRTP